MITVKKKIGEIEYEFQAQGETLKKTFELAALYGQTPNMCALCGSDNLTLTSNRSKKEDKSYLFIKVRCNDCEGTSMLGETKEGTYWWTKWEPRYEGGESE